MKIFCSSEGMFFFINLVLHHMGEDLLHFLTLKLSAVILAPSGTVYMLLGDKGNDGDNSIVPKLITRWVHIARRLVANISPHHALPNRFRLESPMVADIIDFLGSYIVGKFRMQSGSFHRLFPPVRFNRNFSRRKIPA